MKKIKLKATYSPTRGHKDKFMQIVDLALTGAVLKLHDPNKHIHTRFIHILDADGGDIKYTNKPGKTVFETVVTKYLFRYQEYKDVCIVLGIFMSDDEKVPDELKATWQILNVLYSTISNFYGISGKARDVHGRLFDSCIAAAYMYLNMVANMAAIRD